MKKLLVALIIVIVSATLCFGLVACSSEETDIYYEVKGSSLDESSWVELSGGKWKDNGGESGKYELDGDKISFLQDGEELMTGTLKDGTLTLEMWGMPVGTYITKDAYEILKASNREIVPSSGGDQGVSDKDPSSGEGISEGDPSENTQTTYTVTFDANGGALIGARKLTVDAGSKIEAPAAPVYDGHVFVGWSVSTIEKSLWDFSSDTVTKSITLYAYWENEIVVSFNANGGSFLSGDKVKTSIVEKGSRTSAPETPSRENYIFTHWFADARLTARWDFENDTVTSSITLYAGWVYDEKDVTFVLNYDGANNEVKKTTNGKVDYTPERAGYVFNGWWLSSGQTSAGYILSKKFDVSNVVSQNGLTLYAEWVDAATQASQLRAPGVSIENSVFSWDAVPNAEGYRVTVYKSNKNESEMDTVIHATTWTFPDYYDTGYYTVKIRSNGDGLNTINSSYVTKSYAHMILPSVTDISMDISTSIVTWSALDYPANYDVYVNNQLAVSTPSTLFDLSDYEAGSYTIKIEASYGSYTHSVSSRSVMKYRLKSPIVNIELNDEDASYLISWEEILHANQYVVTINGKEIRTEELSYRLSADSDLYDENNEVTISVAAFDTLADYLISVNNAEQKREKHYVVTLLKAPEEGGEVNWALRALAAGEEVTITAKTNRGYTWLGWYKGEEKVSEGNSLTYTFDMPAESVTYTAKWCKVTLERNDSSAGTITSLTDKYNVGEEITVTASTNAGYTWLGWYKGEEKVSEGNSLTYTFDMPEEDVTYTAKWGIAPEMANYVFTSTESTCTITGVKDKSISSAFIPDYVSSIGSAAFSGCTSLEEMTIPFVGSSKSATSASSSTLFGYIFGTSSYTGGTGVEQYYSSSNYSTYYIPSSLRSVTVTDGNILYGAFYGCSSLITVTIPNSVTSIGSSAFSGCSSLTYITIPNSVTSIGNSAFCLCSSLTSFTIPNSVTSIGEYAFQNCSGLTSITIPSGVTSIGNSAFSGCSDLTSVIFAEGSQLTSIGSYAFYGCSSLTSITIPNSVTSIGNSAFSGCASLTSVTFSEGSHLTSIGNYAFSGCSSLTYITIPNSVTSIGNDAFSRCSSLTYITIPNSVTSIGSYAFSGCSSLTSVIFAEGSQLTSIGNDAFYGCSGLTSISIPLSVTAIPYRAFWGCSDLTSVIFAEGSQLTSIGNSAFYGCSSLTSVTIPNSVTSIGDRAFSGCSSLEEMTIPFVGSSKSATSASSSTLFGYIFGTSSYTGGIGVEQDYGSSNYSTYYIPSALRSVTVTGGKILYGAFYGCSMMTSVTIPSGVTSIGWYAFWGCSSLTYITIPNSVTSIGNFAFDDCSSLASITIPSSVTSIGNYAFSGCSSLTSITIPNSVTSIERNAFKFCYKLVEVYNQSSLNVTKGSSDYGCVGYYAKNVYTAAGDSKLSTNEDGYLLYTDGDSVSLIGYVGSETDLTLPDGVTDIYQYAFYGCSSLASITIPNSVTSVGQYAFCGCSSLTSITIPSSVTSIGSVAFSNCSSLTSVTIPNSVTAIPDHAFYNCSSLTSIEYKSTKSWWNSITKESNWWNTNTGAYTIHCTDGDISK